MKNKDIMLPEYKDLEDTNPNVQEGVVWMVYWEQPYEGMSIYGIFSTERKAKEYYNNLQSKFDVYIDSYRLDDGQTW